MLWIRTQERNRLIQTSEIYYGYYKFNDGTYEYFINTTKGNSEVRLGRYDSLDRCKEILNSIEEYLLPDSVLLGGRDSTGEKVFDMPKE